MNSHVKTGGHPAVAELARRAALNDYAEAEAAKARDMLDRGLAARAHEHAEDALHARLAAQAISTDEQAQT
jgi:hypothetical protein